MNRLILIAIICAFGGGVAIAQGTADQKLIVLDEDVWVTFYDLPSRRFRNIRDAFVRRDFDSVSRDLDITVAFLSVEAERAPAELKPAILEVGQQMQSMRGGLSEPSLHVQQLDAVFARAHWLLSQQYLVLATRARDQKAYRSSGRYLIATAHHLERAVLWSNARITKDVVSSLDSIRDMANELQESQTPERVFKDKPVVKAANTLKIVGEQIDRQVRVSELLPE